MFEKRKVVMLPTKQESNIGLNAKTNQLYKYNLAVFHEAIHLYFYNPKPIEDLDQIQVNIPLLFISSNEMIKVITYSDKLIKTPGNYYLIEATTDYNLGVPEKIPFKHNAFGFSLPKPSDSFILKFIEEYNKGNIITEVMVEYWEKEGGFNGVFVEDYEKGIKVNPKDNTITTKKVKTEHTLEELCLIIHKAVKFGRDSINTDIGHMPELTNKWIEQNL